jgi:hypothetical protein
MKKIISICVLIFLCSCSNSDSQADDIYASSSDALSYTSPTLKINKTIFDSLTTNRLNGTSEGDSFEFNFIARNNDILEVEVTYSGGCETHTFEVIWDGIIYTDEPCHANLILVHNANSDTCEASITKTLYIDLKQLIGDIEYKDICEYHLYNTFNSTNTPDIKLTN